MATLVSIQIYKEVISRELYLSIQWLRDEKKSTNFAIHVWSIAFVPTVVDLNNIFIITGFCSR